MSSTKQLFRKVYHPGSPQPTWFGLIILYCLHHKGYRLWCRRCNDCLSWLPGSFPIIINSGLKPMNTHLKKCFFGDFPHDGRTILGKEGRACLDLEMTHRTDATARDAGFTTILYAVYQGNSWMYPDPNVPRWEILSPHPFRVELHHGRRHGCRCNRWLNCSMAGFTAMLLAVGIHNPRRNPTWRWALVFAMIAVAQPTKNGYELSPQVDLYKL